MDGLLLCLTADIIPTRPLASVTAGNEAVFAAIGSADLSVGNFEIGLSGKRAPVEKLLNILAPPEIAADVPKLGVDVVTLANNHSVDHGWPALAETIERLADHGVRSVGAGRDIAEAARPLIVDLAGRRLGVIAFSCLLPAGAAAGPDRPGISPIRVDTAYEIDPFYQMEEPGDMGAIRVRTCARAADVEAATRAISILGAECDTVVVTVHWGFGSGDLLAEYQLPLAHAFIDAGAHVVHGHHPHAVHPVGFHRGRPIFFGLGTLVGQQVFLDASPEVKALWADMSADGCVAFLDLAEDAAITLLPTVLDGQRLPAIASGADFSRIRDRLAKLSQAYGAAVFEQDGKIRVRPSEAARPE